MFELAALAACRLPLPAMKQSHPKDPLHGITLETIVTSLVEQFGWTELAARIPVRCFIYDPSIKSSLTFLRKTPWARAKVEELYVASLRRTDDRGQQTAGGDQEPKP